MSGSDRRGRPPRPDAGDEAGARRTPEEPARAFVPLKSLTQGPPDPHAALAEIRHIYFNTTRQTIESDFTHALELLKSLPSEEIREKAAVFMEGLNEMRREWEKDERRKARSRPPKRRS